MKGLSEIVADNAAITSRLEAKRKASLRRLKQRVARISWSFAGKDPKWIRRGINEAIDAWDAAERAEMLAAYGGKCACCGERHPLFLDLDHVNNDGAEHRREVGNNTQVMLQLKAQGWPTGRVQLLCCNCNQGKARNGGVCPHANDPS